jgi:hypothetical protein
MFTTEEHMQNLVMNAFHREVEVYGYQTNIDNYTTMLSVLPDGAWPEALAVWASSEIDKLPVEMSDEDVQIVSDYQYRDRLRALLRTERVEQGKSRRVLVALKTQIGSGADAAIAAFKAAQGAA